MFKKKKKSAKWHGHFWLKWSLQKPKFRPQSRPHGLYTKIMEKASFSNILSLTAGFITLIDFLITPHRKLALEDQFWYSHWNKRFTKLIRRVWPHWTNKPYLKALNSVILALFRIFFATVFTIGIQWVLFFHKLKPFYHG